MNQAEFEKRFNEAYSKAMTPEKISDLTSKLRQNTDPNIIVYECITVHQKEILKSVLKEFLQVDPQDNQ